MAHAWIIDRDHLAEADLKSTGHVAVDSTATSGPRTAPDGMLAVLNREADNRPGWDVFTFELYDDDRNLYYTGRLITDDASEEACYAPLGDFGAPMAGAVCVEYPGHKDMDCG